MKATKTIAALSLTASSAAYALMLPAVSKTVCLTTYETAQGSHYLTTCDESRNNKDLNRPLLDNGCAEGQAAMTVFKREGQSDFTPKISACLPPNVAQL